LSKLRENNEATISAERLARLEAFLASLPAAAATRLFAALEVGKRKGVDDLPYAAMLAALRRRLFAERARFPARQSDARRLFFTPFEDFFIADRRGRKRRARIARSSLAPIWTLLTTDAACVRARAAAAAIDAVVAAGRPPSEEQRTELFLAAAEGLARLIAHADAEPAFRADLSVRLAEGGSREKGAGALHDLVEIKTLAPISPILSELQQRFPKPVGALGEDALFEARRLYRHVYEEAPDVAHFVLLAIANRLEQPWRGMRLYYHFSTARDDQMPSAREDARHIAELLFEDLEAQARYLEQDSERRFDAASATARLDYLADFAAGIIAEARREGDAPLINRAEASRDLGAAALERFAEQAQAALRASQPMRHAGGSSRLMSLRPDIERALAPADYDAAREGAAFLAAAPASADRLGRPGAVDAVAANATTEIKRYLNDLVLEIRAAEGAGRAAARQRMDVSLDIAAALVPATELSVLKERAAVAAVSA
jgi:hypothetical protein